MNLKEKSAKNKGFTLIELLVVLAIITLIFSLILASMSTARKKARDSQRVQDFAQFSKALELYYNQYGMYPCGDSFASAGTPGYHPTEAIYRDSTGSCPFLNGEDDTLCSVPHPDISDPPGCVLPNTGIYTNGFYSIVWPKDPINSLSIRYLYTARLDRQSYLLRATLEADTNLMQKDGGLCSNYYEYGPGLGDPILISCPPDNP
ncbi:prepilin-type N-terminal cleavage/methylation domain-containing protein [Patescibacteria group bacterium]|nr:prepilin-type N-terminal cleavage/methylation domain-containing protein [Patescibacteria group bacterium]